MNKVFGIKKDFAYVGEDASRIIIGYGLTKIDETHYEWYEVYLNKKEVQQINFRLIQEAIIADIDARTDEKILNSYPFTPDGMEEPITVWLSKESQTNFSEAHRLQVIPITFKLNETENKQAIYHTFTDFEELDRFYRGGVTYINQCLHEGWQEKDTIDWAPYEALFPQSDNANAEQAL